MSLARLKQYKKFSQVCYKCQNAEKKVVNLISREIKQREKLKKFILRMKLKQVNSYLQIFGEIVPRGPSRC